MPNVIRILGVILLLLAALLPHQAAAQTDPYANCNNTASSTGFCPNPDAAYTALMARLQSVADSNINGNNSVCYDGYTTANNGTYGRYSGHVGKAGPNGPCQYNFVAGSYRDFPINASCPTEKIWNSTTHRCIAPCDGKPQSLGQLWTSDAGPAASLSACDGTCGYAASSSAVPVCKVVDGVKWCSVYGWTQSTEVTCAADGSSGNNFGTPPADGDGDGTSDGNDSAPTNPGTSTPPTDPDGTGSKPPPTGDGNDDGKGSGNGNTSSGGGNCATPPSSNGDQILANIAYQAWATRCAIEHVTNSGAIKIKGAGSDGAVNVSGMGTGSGFDPQSDDSVGGISCTPEGSVASFACSGDAIGCKQAEQLAIANCRAQAKDSDGNGQPDWTQGDEPDIAGDGDGDYTDADLKRYGVGIDPDQLDTDNIFGGGTCPAFTMKFLSAEVSTAEIPHWCDLIAPALRGCVLLFGAYLALQILVGRGMS